MEVPDRLLGSRKDPKWRDMSRYLVHFTDSAEKLAAILGEQHIRAVNRYGWARKAPHMGEKHRSACFSEIPIDMLDRLVRRHGPFGVAFTREFVHAAGGERVWYLQQPELQSALFAEFSWPTWAQTAGEADPLWKLSPFIDLVTDQYSFDWEREWRVPGGLRFTLADVQFLIIPAGASPTLFENPAPGVATLPASSVEFWSGVVDALGDQNDKWVRLFLETFADPMDYLSWDEMEDLRMMHGVSTRDALNELFGDTVPPELREALAVRLDDVAETWLRFSDLLSPEGF